MELPAIILRCSLKMFSSHGSTRIIAFCLDFFKSTTATRRPWAPTYNFETGLKNVHCSLKPNLYYHDPTKVASLAKKSDSKVYIQKMNVESLKTLFLSEVQ